MTQYFKSRNSYLESNEWLTCFVCLFLEQILVFWATLYWATRTLYGVWVYTARSCISSRPRPMALFAYGILNPNLLSSPFLPLNQVRFNNNCYDLRRKCKLNASIILDQMAYRRQWTLSATTRTEWSHPTIRPLVSSSTWKRVNQSLGSTQIRCEIVPSSSLICHRAIMPCLLCPYREWRIRYLVGRSIVSFHILPFRWQ